MALFGRYFKYEYLSLKHIYGVASLQIQRVHRSTKNRLAQRDVQHMEYDCCDESELRIADKSEFVLAYEGKRFDVFHVLICYIFRYVLGGQFFQTISSGRPRTPEQ